MDLKQIAENLFGDSKIGLTVSINVTALGAKGRVLKKRKPIRFKVNSQAALDLLEFATSAIPNQKQDQVTSLLADASFMKEQLSKIQVQKLFEKAGIDLDDPQVVSFLENRLPYYQPDQA